MPQSFRNPKPSGPFTRKWKTEAESAVRKMSNVCTFITKHADTARTQPQMVATGVKNVEALACAFARQWFRGRRFALFTEMNVTTADEQVLSAEGPQERPVRL